MVFKLTWFYCQPDMTSSSVLHQEALHAHIHDWFWKSDHDFLIAFHSKYLSAMHGFRDIEDLLPTGYDVIISPLPGTLHAYFQVGFWKSEHDFLISFHSNILSGMHGFRDNVVLFQARCDVIVISSPGGAARIFLTADLKGRPRVYINVAL